MKQTQIQPEVVDILRQATITGNNVVLNSGQLDRKMYVAVDKVLKELGGQWNTKAKAHIFPTDPKEIFGGILESEKMIFAKDNGYYPTPPELAKTLIDWAELYPGCSVLEPSAGTGNLADAIVEKVPDAGITCIELNPKFISVLEEKGYNSGLGTQRITYNEDFLNMDVAPLYDRVIMNPPFDKSQTEIDHVLQAMICVKDGGILLAILPTGVIDRENLKSRKFQEFMHDNDAEIVRNSQGSFKESGTMVNTIRVKIQKNRNNE